VYVFTFLLAKVSPHRKKRHRFIKQPSMNYHSKALPETFR